MAEFMKAVWYRAYKGGPSALEQTQLPVPKPRKGEVLVKVEAASVNPVDWKIQTGAFWPLLPRKIPYVPGTDIAGEVVQAGPGVTGFGVGEKVVAWLDLQYGGALAEYAIAKPGYLAKRPPQVSAETGASLPCAGMTALQSLKTVAGFGLEGNYKGNILVTAASGGVGTYAVQLAKLGGAHVTATCGSRNVELVKSLGADEVLDYKTEEGAQLKSPSGRKYNAIIHCATQTPWATFEKVLEDNGRTIEITPSAWSLLLAGMHKATFANKRLVNFVMSANSTDLQLLVDLTAEGKLKTVIDSRHPLAEAAKAWEKSINGPTTGKIVVTVP